MYQLQFCSLLYGKEKGIILDIDQYSAVTVSDKMRLFMKALYTTNRRGQINA
jgi:hypothetical protein